MVRDSARDRTRRRPWRPRLGVGFPAALARRATVLCGRTRFGSSSRRGCFGLPVLLDDEEIGRFPRERGLPTPLVAAVIRASTLGGCPAVVEAAIPGQLDRKIRRGLPEPVESAQGAPSYDELHNLGVAGLAGFRLFCVSCHWTILSAIWSVRLGCGRRCEWPTNGDIFRRTARGLQAAPRLRQGGR